MALKHFSVTRVVADVIKVIIGQSIAHVTDWWEAQIHTVIIVAMVIWIVIIYWRISFRSIGIMLIKVPLIRSLFIPRVSASFSAPRALRRRHLRRYVLWRRINLDTD